MVANKEIREKIKKSKVPQYEVARRCGVSEWTFCRWLREELKEDDRRYTLIAKALNEGEPA